MPASSRTHSSGWPDSTRNSPVLGYALSAFALLVAFLPLLLLGMALFASTGRWPSDTWPALWHSLGYAVVASVLSCTLAWLAVEALLIHRQGVMWFAAGCLLLLFWPSTLVGLELVRVDLAYWLGDDAVMVLAHAVHIFPYAALLLAGWRLTDPVEREQQLALLSGSVMHRYGLVILPANMRRWAFVVVLGICLSLGELSSTVLTVPPGVETIILRIYNLMHYGDRFGVISLALLQSAAVAMLSAFGFWLIRKENHA